MANLRINRPNYFVALLWIIVNIVGFYFVNSTGHLWSIINAMGILRTNSSIELIIYFIGSGLILAISQLIFVLIFPITKLPFLWFICSWFAVSFSILFNTIIFPGYLYPSIEIAINHSSSFIIYNYSGISINSGSLVETLLSVLIYGAVLGCVDGGVLGISQFKLIIDPAKSMKWLLKTLLSLTIAILLSSFILSAAPYILKLGSSAKEVYPILSNLVFILVGLVYGVTSVTVILPDLIKKIR